MKPAKSILYAAAALALAAGSAIAEPSAYTPSASTIYEVDEDRDGRTDRLLILEHSDSLA
jgi:hypothetical protein